MANTPDLYRVGWTFTAPQSVTKNMFLGIKFEEFELMEAFEKLGASPMEVNRGDFYYRGEPIMPIPSDVFDLQVFDLAQTKLQRKRLFT